MTENIKKLQEIIENQTPTSVLESKVLSICSIEAVNQRRFCLDMQTIRELNNYCLEQLKLPQTVETLTQLQAISNILEQNLQLEF